MKSYRFSENSRIFDRLGHARPTEIKKLVRYVLTSGELGKTSSELCMLVDLKTILGLYPASKDLKILTQKQKCVILEHLMNNKTQVELAEELKITQQGVSILLKSALGRVKKYLIGDIVKWTQWTSEEKGKLVREYKQKPIYKLSLELDKPASRVVSMYHYLKNKDEICT